jgi:hypothetical protein
VTILCVCLFVTRFYLGIQERKDDDLFIFEVCLTVHLYQEIVCTTNLMQQK